MDNTLYEEYLEQLVVEVEAKVGAMPECLLKPLSNESSSNLLNPHYASPRMSVVDEVVLIVEDTKSSPSLIEKQDDTEKDFDTKEETSNDKNNKKHMTKSNKSIDTARSSSSNWIKRVDALEENLRTLKDSMKEIRNQDLHILRQLLHVNDSIEEMKWLTENYDLVDGGCKDTALSRSLSRYDSREQLHERWISERRLLTSSKTSLNTSIPNLSRLNQNNNSNGLLEGQQGNIGVAFGPDDSPIAGSIVELFHSRSMSTSCMDNPVAAVNNMSPQLLPRPASSTGLVRLDTMPVTSTPKADTNIVEESNASRDSMVVADGQVSRVRVGSYGSQVRWLYKETEEDELFL